MLQNPPNNKPTKTNKQTKPPKRCISSLLVKANFKKFYGILTALGFGFFFLKSPEFSDIDHTSQRDQHLPLFLSCVFKVRIKLARWSKRSLHCQRPGRCHPRTDLALELLCTALVFSPEPEAEPGLQGQLPVPRPSSVKHNCVLGSAVRGQKIKEANKS